MIHINNLSEDLTTNARLFADDVSLFSVVDNINLSATNLNSDLNKINANSIKQVQFQKHLGVYLYGKLDFHEHLQNIFKKLNKTISLLRKLQKNLSRASLVTIYKFFIRTHLDYGDILCEHTFHNSFHENLESIQHNAALAITGAIRGSSIEKRYQELGLESLQQRRW